MEGPEDDIDELEADIDADEVRQLGYRQSLETLGIHCRYDLGQSFKC